eukprot:11357-Prymnesium_polylepis.1
MDAFEVMHVFPASARAVAVAQLNMRAQDMIKQILVTTERELGLLIDTIRQQINVRAPRAVWGPRHTVTWPACAVHAASSLLHSPNTARAPNDS